MMILSMVSYSQTQITDSNFQTAINACLSTNSIDGMFSDSVYGAMPDWNVSQVTNMSNAFKDRATFNGDISGWDVSSVTSVVSMFQDATSFNGDISEWDVSNVTSMIRMFYNANNFNQDISGWDVSSVTDMVFMFLYSSSFNQDISSWCVTNIASEPGGFTPSSFSESNKPVWGTCPGIP